MAQFLLADAVANRGMNQAEDVLYLIFLALLLVPFLILMIWLMRRLRVSQDNMKRALEQNDESIKLLSRSCEHSEASERHLASIENKIEQVIEQLKRRPLS